LPTCVFFQLFWEVPLVASDEKISSCCLGTLQKAIVGRIARWGDGMRRFNQSAGAPNEYQEVSYFFRIEL
jgi:hypothetical protein